VSNQHKDKGGKGHEEIGK